MTVIVKKPKLKHYRADLPERAALMLSSGMKERTRDVNARVKCQSLQNVGKSN